MTWPSAPGFIKTNLDAGSDSPATARSDLHNALTDLENVIAGRDAADGVCPLDGATLVPTANLPSIPIAKIPLMPVFNGILSNPGPVIGATFTVPAGVTKLTIFIAGAGGGGAYDSDADHQGGGGGAGATMIIFATVTPGQVLTYTIGTGGSGKHGPTSGDGADGNDSQITIGGTTYIARGGKGGEDSSGDSYGGDGGQPDHVAGAICCNGGNGSPGTTRGGNGGSGVFGASGGSGVGGLAEWGGGGTGAGGSVLFAFDGSHGGITIIW